MILNVTGQGFGPTSIDGQYPTSVGGFGFNPQTSFNPNQFYGGFTPATSSGTLPFNTQTFNQGFQPQIPQVYGIQSPNERRFNIGQLPSSAGLSPLFPTAAQVPFNGQFPATTSQFGTPGQFLTGGGGVGGSQFPTTGQIPTTTTITTGQFLIPGQFPIAGQSPTYGQSPTIAGQFPTLGQLPSQSQFPTPGHLPTSPPFSATSQLAPINDQSLLIRTPENLPLVPQPHLQDSDIGFTRQRSPIGRTTSATTRFIRLEPVQKRNTRENDQPVGRTL